VLDIHGIALLVKSSGAQMSHALFKSQLSGIIWCLVWDKNALRITKFSSGDVYRTACSWTVCGCKLFAVCGVTGLHINSQVASADYNVLQLLNYCLVLMTTSLPFCSTPTLYYNDYTREHSIFNRQLQWMPSVRCMVVASEITDIVYIKLKHR
jgi:hypothetical protein